MVGIKAGSAGIEVKRSGNQRAIDKHTRQRDDGHHDDGEYGKICFCNIRTFTRHSRLSCGFLLMHFTSHPGFRIVSENGNIRAVHAGKDAHIMKVFF
jgi:hypothetical protein